MIQSNPDMKTKSKVINGHSSEVGMKIYDKSNSRVKSEFVNFMHNKEQNQNEAHAIDLEKEKKMLTLEQADEEERKRDAIQFLTKEKGAIRLSQLDDYWSMICEMSEERAESVSN